MDDNGKVKLDWNPATIEKLVGETKLLLDGKGLAFNAATAVVATVARKVLDECYDKMHDQISEYLRPRMEAFARKLVADPRAFRKLEEQVEAHIIEDATKDPRLAEFAKEWAEDLVNAALTQARPHLERSIADRIVKAVTR